LLHPAADHEVRRVSCSCRPEPAGEGGSVRSRDPRGAHRTPRRMFPVDSRTASPRPLPSCRWRAACGATLAPTPFEVGAPVAADGCVGFRALLRRRVRGHACIVADAGATRSFLGLGFPSRSILRTAGAPSSHRPTPTDREIGRRSSVPHPQDATSLCRLANRAYPLPGRTRVAAPVGPAAGRRSVSPKARAVAESALATAEAVAAPRARFLAPPKRRLDGTWPGRNPFERFTRERVYPRGAVPDGRSRWTVRS